MPETKNADIFKNAIPVNRAGSALPFTPATEQKEKRQHGKVIFPIEKYTTKLHSEYLSVPLHWHDEAEFTLIRDGQCTYQVQLQTFNVSAGDLVFIPPVFLHSVGNLNGEMVSDTYVFHMNFLGAGMGDICSLQYLSPLTNQTLVPPFIIGKQHPLYKDALELFMMIDGSWEAKKPGHELVIKSALLRLIALLLPYCTESSKIPAIQTEHTFKLKTALEYIAMHYTEDISISDVASACYFSEYHFMRFFKKHVGMSCFDYIKNYRLEKAVELMDKGGISILDASLAAGFRNLSYFYRAFKEKYNMTPKEWIKNKK